MLFCKLPVDDIEDDDNGDTNEDDREDTDVGDIDRLSVFTVVVVANE